MERSTLGLTWALCLIRIPRRITHVPTIYIVETFSNVVYQNTSIQPNINQSIPGYSDIAGSPGPNAGSQDSCPADTSGSSTYNGTGYTIYYYGGNAYIYVP